MDMKKYEIFALLAETGNISKAAELSGYTQSGVSHMIKSMESELGIQLITRDRYGVHLTSIGTELLPFVRNLVNEHKKMEQFIYDVHGIEKGTLTIGTFSSVSIHWLPPILDQFQKDHPLIDIRLKEGGIHDIEQWITNKEVDLGFYSRQPGHHFEFIHIQDDPLVAVLPKDYETDPSMTSFPIEEFEGKSFILSEMGVDYDINRILKHQNVHPDVRFSAKDDYAIMSMVEHNLGISILPRLITQSREKDLKLLPLSPASSRELGIGLNNMQAASPVAKKFIWFVQEYFHIQ